MFKFLIALAIALGAVLYVPNIGFLSHIEPEKEETVLWIPPQSSLMTIAQKIQLCTTHKFPHPFVYMASRVKSLKAGEYKIKRGETLAHLLNRISNGDVIKRSITFIEGKSIHDAINIINKEPYLEGEKIDPSTVLEGSLMPDTYFYTRGDDRETVLKRMKISMDTFMKQFHLNPRLDPNDGLILASIIQKEMADSGEATVISSVFHNRLKLGMPLQADPTVIYALTKGEKDLGGPLSKKDLRTNSPFNTYKNRGLPPSPICCPGRKAIKRQ